MATEIINLHPALFVWLLVSVIVFMTILSAACYVVWDSKYLTMPIALAIVAVCLLVAFSWPLMSPLLMAAGFYRIYWMIKKRHQLNTLGEPIEMPPYQHRVSQLRQMQSGYIDNYGNTTPESTSEISELDADQSVMFSIFDENLDHPPYLMNTVSEKVEHQLLIIYVDNSSKHIHRITDETMCTICLTPINFQDHDNSCPEFDTANNDDPCATSCDHVLHYGCLWEWLMANPSCPTCRKSTIKQCVLLRTIGPIINTTTSLPLSKSNMNSRHKSSTYPTTKLTKITQLPQNMLASVESLVSNVSIKSDLTIGMYGPGTEEDFA